MLFWNKFLRLRHARLSFGQFSLAPCEEPGRKSPTIDRSIAPEQNRPSMVQSQQGTINNNNTNNNHIQNPSNLKMCANFKTKPTKQKKRKLQRLRLIPGEISSIQFPWSQVPVARGPATRSLSKSQRVRGGWTASPVGTPSPNRFELCARTTGRLHSDPGKRA